MANCPTTSNSLKDGSAYGVPVPSALTDPDAPCVGTANASVHFIRSRMTQDRLMIADSTNGTMESYFIDAVADESLGTTGAGENAAARHDSRCNAAFADGHAEALQKEWFTEAAHKAYRYTVE